MKTVRPTANKVDVYHIVRFSEGRQKMIVNNLILLCTSYQAEEYKGEHAYYMLYKKYRREMKIALAAKLKKAAFKHVEAKWYCYHDSSKEIQMI
jgi:hypothetical protein